MVFLSINTQTIPVIFGLLQLFIPTSSAAFFRTALDVSPYSYPYTTLAGSVNLTTAQVTPDQRVNSYWTAYYITGSNGHDYFVCGNAAEGFGDDHILSRHFRVMITDITAKTSWGATILTPEGTLSNDTFHFQSNKYQAYSTTPDLFSAMVTISTVENATFTLITQPKGPNLYHAGSGTHFWGDDRTFQHANPELYVTGNLTYNGETVDVISSKSTAWYDRQYGPGLATAGWNLFFFYLENGVKGSMWHTLPINNGPVVREATVLFPDGHHEVYAIADDIQPAIPFTSSLTNATYHGHHRVEIIGLATLDFDLPVLAGEMTPSEAPIPQLTLFEGYSDVKGVFRGEPVRGFGVSEQRNPN